MSRAHSQIVASVALGLLCSFSALSQSSPSRVQKHNQPLPVYVLDARLALNRPIINDSCWCANGYPDCASESRWSWARLNFFTSEIRQVDLEGLKKLIERDPKDPQPLLVNFWATWCDPCREEFPDLVKIDADYRAKKLNFVAVSLDDIADIGTTVPKFLKEMKASMPVVLLSVTDPEPAIKAMDLTWDGQLPATFLYDRDGKVVFKHFGRFNTEELRAAIDKALGSKQ